MVAESSGNDRGNIPERGLSVNAVLRDAVKGAPVCVQSHGLVVQASATVADRADVCVRIFRAAARMTRDSQFCLGDTYESYPPYSTARKALLAAVSAALGPACADRLRGFGSVCRRWPIDRRSDKLPWQYYRTHRPGVPGKPDVPIEKRPRPLLVIGRSPLPHGVLLTLRNQKGDEFTAVLSNEEAVNE